MRQYFYMFILYSDFGKKIKDVINSLIPGLIPEPCPVKVPVRRTDERQTRQRKW